MVGATLAVALANRTIVLENCERTHRLLVDSHCHIDTSRFNADREAVIQAAFEGGVTRMVDAGCDLASSEHALALAKTHRGIIFAGVGTHPHDALTHTEEIGLRYREMAKEPEVVAIGEFGLDYFRMLSPRDVQRAVFVAHLQLARECNLPCIIHVRDAHDDVIELLRVHGQGLRGVFHCFSGDARQAGQCLEFDGFMLSFAGPLTRQGNALPAVARMAPLERILVETDSPYLVPQPLRAKRNEPLFVKYVAEKLAEIRGMTLEEVALATTANAVRLFGLGESTR
ncbi:MAG TPA: TatD family hydrolase [Ktedonobacteraceae bacterium]|nr:TatD family hydrolase [Ktedonobacteraceae bacterium]